MKSKDLHTRIEDCTNRLISAMTGGYGYRSLGDKCIWKTAYVMLFRTPDSTWAAERDNPAAIASRTFGGTWKRSESLIVYTATLPNGLRVRAKYCGPHGSSVIVAIGSTSCTLSVMQEDIVKRLLATATEGNPIPQWAKDAASPPDSWRQTTITLESDRRSRAIAERMTRAVGTDGMKMKWKPVVIDGIYQLQAWIKGGGWTSATTKELHMYLAGVMTGVTTAKG